MTEGVPLASVADFSIDADSAWLFPGQGAQHVGMGHDLYERSPAARAVFEAADAALEAPISALCFAGPEEELTRTVNAQPALLTHSLAALAAAIEAGTVTERPAFAAGHSLGEYSALVAAGAITLDHGVRLARERGERMQQACDAEPGTMAAVLGLEAGAVAALCEQHGASVCNVNAPGNITIGGTIDAVSKASEAATQAGASRVVQLDVAGAFHTPLMRGVGEALRPALDGAGFVDPHMPVLSNVTARPLTAATQLASELIDQITSPVCWADCVRAMLDGGVTSFIEFGPGRVLTGLVRRTERSATLRNIATAEDVFGDGSGA